MIKKLIIPAALVAITATGASAFAASNGFFENLNLDLSQDQISALEEAREIRENANEQAQQVLENAGLDAETMHSIRESMHEAHRAEHQAIHDAVESGDYQAFQTAIANGPLADIITNQSQFEKFVEAHELRAAGDHEGAQAIMDELGIERPMMGEKGGRGFGRHEFNAASE